MYTPYSSTLYDIRDDGTAATDIDHVVALAEAYDSGLDSLRCREFGENSLDLTISVPTLNRHQESDKDAADWSRQAEVRDVDQSGRVDSLAVMLAADSSRTVVCGQSG